MRLNSLNEFLIHVTPKTEAVRRGFEKIKTKEQGERKGAQEHHEIPQGKQRARTKPVLFHK